MFGLGRKRSRQEQAQQGCAGKGKGHGGREGRGGKGGRGSRGGRGMGGKFGVRGESAPWLSDRFGREGAYDHRDQRQSGQPVQQEQSVRELRNEVPATAKPAAQITECPICENHCSLDDPACPKGQAYARSLQARA